MKTNKILLYGIIVVLIVGAVVAYAYYTGQDGRKIVVDNTNQLIGGQTDEGGCLIGAGYSWCEPKKKCLRIWEEKCFDAEEAALKKIFAANHQKAITETNVTVMQLKNNFVSGSISFGPEPGEGGGFLARLADNAWIIDYEGNGSIDCVKIKELGYPQEVLEGYCD